MSRTVTLAGYVVIAVAIVALQVSAHVARRPVRATPTRPLTFGEFLTLAARRAEVRCTLLAGWLWLGWHVFSRVDWR